MKKTLALILTAALAGSGFAASGVAMAKKDKPAPEIRAVGQPANCVFTRNIRSTKVVDKYTIDFKMRNGKTYRNVMANSCPGLTNEKAFSYRTSTSQLCNVDIIRVLENYGGRLETGASCGLGKFQQIEKVAAAS